MNIDKNLVENKDTKKSVNEGVTIEKLQNLTTDNYKELHPNSFPFWVFPEAFHEIILETNKCLGFPIDFTASSIFFTCSLANGLTTKVEVKPGWTESSIMYMCLVGRAGTNKSHPLSWALKPLRDHDNESYSRYEKAMEEYDNNGKKPKWEKFLATDFTIEALTQIHKFNRRGLGVYSDEINGWLGNMNRYNSGSEVEFWLSVWSSKSITVDRVTSMSTNIADPFISVIGTIQNSLISQLSKGNNSGNGFMDRMLFVMPDNLRKEQWSDNVLPERILDNYSSIIKNIMDIELDIEGDNSVNSTILTYSQEAYSELKGWQAKNAMLYNKQTNFALDGILSKQEVFVNRFALTIQIMIDACKGIRSNQVSLESVKGAIELSNYFIRQSKKVRLQNVRDDLLQKFPEKRKLYNELPHKFTTSQAAEIASDSLGKNVKFVQRFLKERNVFKKIDHGVYEKIIF